MFFSGTVIEYWSNWQACVRGRLIALLSEGYSKELVFIKLSVSVGFFNGVQGS